MQILDGICANLYVPKDGVDNVMKGDRTSICSYIMWASFKTHDISKEYPEFKFENHPAILSEFIRFLAMNSGFEEVERLTDQVDTLKTKLNLATEEMKQASAKCDTASTICAQLPSEVATLTR